MEDSGYIQDLKEQSTEESEERLKNVLELYNAVLQFEEENEDASLSTFLASASLASDLDDLTEEQSRVSLMTLHASKGLEFPIVFLVGLEQGLFPSFRSLDDPSALEEERRLCYVGITRAQERLFISYARERRLYGTREFATPSIFLSELPRELLQTNTATALPAQRQKVSEKTTGTASRGLGQKARGQADPSRSPSGTSSGTRSAKPWEVGDRVLHEKFGQGQITHVFENGKTLAIKFPDQGIKVIDPKLAVLERAK